MWSEFKKRILRGGVSPEIYRLIEPDIIKSNWGNLHRFSSLVFFALLCMIIASFFESSLEKNRALYLITGGFSTVIMLLSLGPCRKNPKWVNPCVYLFQALMLFFGVTLCTIVDPNEVAVSFVIILFVLPLLFTDKPITVCIILLCGILMYIVMERFTLAHLKDNARAYEVRGYNLTNILPYSVLSAVISSYMMRIKIERFAYILQNKRLSETDQMTGLLNRRSYSLLVDELREAEPSEQLIVCSIDVNGLKVINDSMGHSAGDELICAAASCIKEELGMYGQCFRTGGDEFVVIITELKEQSINDLKKKLQQRSTSWRSRIINNLSLSVGIVQNTEKLNIDELLAKADAAMYVDKALYYETNGKRRR